MTGFNSKRKIAQDRLDDDDVQVYAKPRLDQGPDYERGFVDGMMYQTQSSVDKAVNRMAQPAQEPVDNDFFKVLARNNPSPDKREWVGLTYEEIEIIYAECNVWDKFEYERMLEAKLKEKNA
jgi:hypothetical protein